MSSLKPECVESLGLWPGEGASLEERVCALEAVRAVTEVAYLYAEAVDARDGQAVGGLFAEDGCLRPVPDADAIVGAARIAKLYGRLLPQMASSTHVVSNPQVTLLSATEARLRCVLWAWEGFGDAPQEPPADRYTFGRYLMHLVRDDGGRWSIRSMDILFAGQTGSPRFAEHLR